MPPTHLFPATRREFLRTASGAAGLLAFSRFAPSFLVQSTLAAAPAPERDRSILVLVQLAGGNDGLNTVVPYADPAYRKLRPTIGLPEAELLKLDATTALHPALAAFHRLYDAGQGALVQNVGYPNPNRSHFRSTEIWEGGTDAQIALSTGWIGRYLDHTCSGSAGPASPGAASAAAAAKATRSTAAGTAATSDPLAVHFTNELPQSYLAGQSHPTFGVQNRGGGGRNDNLKLLETLAHDPGAANANASFLKATLMDALVTERKVQSILNGYKPGAAYPGNPFAQSLRSIAALIAAGLSTRVYFVSLGGFDTHANQLRTHANQLTTLAEGLAAFQQDLTAKKLDDQVLTMTFSEFGRRPSENESQGTDHGTAAPLLLLGSRLKGGLHGTPPALADLTRNQDLTFSTDFRQVYATVLERWLGCPASAVLTGKHEPLGFL